MTKLAILAAIAAATLFVQPHIAVADEVPTLDVRSSCRAAAQAYPGGGGNAACLADEQKARDTLVSQWTQFAPESRARCSQMVTNIAGAQSYVELLSCLQVAKDVKTLPKE